MRISAVLPCSLIVFAFAVFAAPIWGQDIPDLAKLPVMTGPGTLQAEALPDQGFWLDVTAPGVYQMVLDGPGLLGLTGFETGDGRSDGSDRQERLLQDGSAYLTGQLDDLFLLPGHAYLIQIAGLMPRGVTLALRQPVDLATALTEKAIPGATAETPLVLDVTAGQMPLVLLQPDGSVTLNLTAPAAVPIRLNVLTPPHAEVRKGFESVDIGPAGIYPIAPFDQGRVTLDGQPGLDGALPFFLLQATAMPDPQQIDDREPGDTDLGSLTAAGRSIHGVLLAKDDRDSFLMELREAAVLDLGVQITGSTRNSIELSKDGVTLLAADFEAGQLFRPGLTLDPGSYRLDIAGAQDWPRDYTIDLAPTAQAVEGEPDDNPALARNLTEGKALRGTLAPGNPGNIRFSVPTAGHLWELRGVQGIADLQLVDGNDTVLGNWQAANGALVLRLALSPGTYTARLRGDGPYALRLADKGAVPTDFEIEPNDSDINANRLKPGMAVSGDFQTNGDSDFYEINLPAPTPLNITVTGPDDGAAVVEIFVADSDVLRAELPKGAAPVSYAAVFPAGRHVIQFRALEDGISGRYHLQIARSDQPEPDEPSGVSAMPGDGNIGGLIGGFDAEDRVFMPLPQGEGNFAIVCKGALQSWEIWTFGDETRLARGRAGETVVLPYAPETGGGLSLRISADAGAPSGGYDCKLRFAPGDLVAVLPNAPHDEAQDDTAANTLDPNTLAPGASIGGTFDSNRDRDTIALAAVTGQFVGLSCDVPTDRLRGSGILRQALDAPPIAQDVFAFLTDGAPATLEINPPSEGAFPISWRCALLDEAAFQVAAMMGPAAEFSGFRDPAAQEATDFDPALTLNLLSGGRAEWLNPTQVTNDLAVELSVTGLETGFRAYDRLGQAAQLTLQARNPGDVAMQLRYQLSALADGWRVDPAEGSLDLAPGASATVPFTVELPPMQSPINDPQLQVTVWAADKTAALTVPVILSPAAAQREPHPFWTAPAGLRGGLNPMLYQFGARLIALDGEEADADTAERFSFVHDGAALHAGIPAWFRAHEATFKLAEQAPIAGLYVHLRTTENRKTWPGHLALELSQDGQSWRPAVSVALTASDLPQIFALNAPIEAAFARISIPGCRTDPACSEIALSEVGLIAQPDWRMSQPINLADPALGGHVVWAQELGGPDVVENPFGGGWNSDLLTAGRAEKFSAARKSLGDKVVAVIGFHGARAGKITSIQWDGTEDDITRLDGAEVDVSLTGPAGPWQNIGRLIAPPVGSLTARLDLTAPVWARALRLTFQRDGAEERALPDRVRIWEDPAAPPLLGLWEDDRPDAGYEASAPAQTGFTPDPLGGPDRDHPAVLALGQTVASSVQLERNADWWRIDLDQGPPRHLVLRFAAAARPAFSATLIGPAGAEIPLNRATNAAGDLILTAAAGPGSYLLSVHEPPRSVAILWDTSGSVAAFVPGILEAVRLWSQSLQPGRDRLQLLPFGQDAMLLDDWADAPEQVFPALSALPRNDSSDSETAMGIAAQALVGQEGQRGIVVLTDAETSQSRLVWSPLMQAMPRVVALSIDSSEATGVHVMKDWASLNGGYFTRVTGNAGLADGLDLAAALFRAPKGYVLTASAEELREPEGAGNLLIRALPSAPDAPPTGGIEVILDASGSMLQRMPDGQRRIAVAHDALAGLVEKTLPEGTPFAFRAFGLDKDACNSDLIVPLGPLQGAAAAATIRDVPAINGAKTAIAASLALAAQDLAKVAPPRVVVLVTDGEETCDGDVAAEIARLRDSGLDLRLTIVGFAIDDAALSATFAGWAQDGGGQYLSAGDSAGLDASITQAIAPRFAIDRLFVDGRAEQVGVVGLDQDMPLPAGKYRLRPMQTAQGGATEFDLADGATAALTYDPTIGISEE